MKEKFYKDFSKSEPKEATPKAFVAPSKCSITADFKSATKLIQHVSSLSDEGKKSLAAKYGISYKDVSEIRGNARKKFWDS